MKTFLISAAILSVSMGASAGVIITARPVVTARPIATARAAPVMRSAPVSSLVSSTAFIPVYVPMILHSHNADTAEQVQVATPLLTVCTKEQFDKAKLWQSDCSNVNEINPQYCPILSYFRYCHEASPDEVKDLKPAGDNYHHVFMAK